jgi:hypothetical protein
MCERLTAGDRKGNHSLKTVKYCWSQSQGTTSVKNKSHDKLKKERGKKVKQWPILERLCGKRKYIEWLLKYYMQQIKYCNVIVQQWNPTYGVNRNSDWQKWYLTEVCILLFGEESHQRTHSWFWSSTCAVYIPWPEYCLLEIILCSLVDIYRSFGGMDCLLLQVGSSFRAF